jgi:hypothetical protein
VTMKSPVYFDGSLIAQVAKVHLKTIKRHAAKHGWAGRLRGNAWEFVPPSDLQAKCAEAASLVNKQGMDSLAIGTSQRAELFRANLRFAALCALETAITTLPIETALATVARDMSFKISPSSLREWLKRYSESGFPGLMEYKRGRCGRKPKAKP